MDILKVQFKGDETIIEYTNQANVDTKNKTVLKSSSLRSAAFTDAMSALIPDLENLVAFDKKYLERMHVTGIKFTKNDKKGLGASLFVSKELSHNENQFCFETPIYHKGAEGQDKGVFDKGTFERIEFLRDEAIEFVNGVRAQQELFEDNQETADSADEAEAA